MPKLLPEETKLTALEQAQVEMEEARRLMHEVRKSTLNTKQQAVDIYEEMGITPPAALVAEAQEFNTTLNAEYMGMSEEEITQIKTSALEPKGLVGWGLDKLLRTTYAAGAFTEAAFNTIAPPQSETRAAVHRMFKYAVDTFNATGDEVAALSMLAEGAKDPAIIPPVLTRTASSAKIAVTADPTHAPLYLYNGIQKVWDWFQDDGKKYETESLLDRVKMVDRLGGAAPVLTMVPVANELFSGLGPLQGQKRGLMGEVLPEVTGLADEATPTGSDFAAKRLARDLGFADPSEVDGTLFSVGVPGLTSEVEFRHPDGRVETGSIQTVVRTIDTPVGPVPMQLFGPQIGITETGDGLLAVRRGGLLDPNSQEVAGLVGEAVLDPLTYVGVGAEARALGRPLSQKGLRLLEAETKRVSLARAQLLRDAAAEGGDKAAEAMARQFRQTPSRLDAEKAVIDAAREDASLLAPRGEVRFMGVPVAAIGGSPTKETLAKQLVNKSNVEKLWSKFRRSMPRTSASAMSVYDTVEGAARQISSWFRPSLTRQEEWLYARAAAQGVAMGEQAAFDKRLSVMVLDKAEEELTMQLLGDPMIAATRPPLKDNVQKMMAMNDELDMRYTALHQEVTKEVPLQTAQDWVDTLPKIGRSGLSERLNKRIAETLAANPEAKGLPRIEVFFNNSDELLQQYTSALAEEFTRFRHKHLNEMAAAVKRQFKAKVHPRNLKDVSQADRKLMTEMYTALETKGAAGLRQVTERLKKSLDDKGQMLMGKGDYGSIITPLSRDELMEVLGTVQRRNKLYKLKPVTNPRQHLLLRSQTVNNKTAYQFLLRRTADLVQDDAFARRVFERHLAPIGVLQRHMNVDQKRVQDAWDSYKLARAKQGGPVYAESAGFHPGAKGTRVKIADTTKPGGAPMSAALKKLKSKEEIQLFVRQWLVDPAEGKWAEGSMSYRFYQFMQAMNDEAAKLADDVVEQFPVEPGLGKPARLAQFTMDQFANEARELRAVLSSKGMSLNDVLPRVNLSGQLFDDGSRWVQYKKLKREGDSWRLLSSTTGDAMYVPRSVAAELDRMVNVKGKNAELRGFLSFWDGYTNFTKLGLTAIGGFPAFQVRNLYTNVAFMLMGAHLHLLRTAHKIPKMAKLAFLNSDPALAVTADGYRGSLRVAAMNQLSLAADVTLDLPRAKAVVKELYSSGAKSAKAGRKGAARIAADDKLLTQEAQTLLDNLNEVVLKTDLGHDYTMKEIMLQSKLQGVDIDGKVLAEFTGGAERFASSRSRAALNAGRDKLMRLNTFFEQWSRQQLFITYLSRGVGPEEAGRLVNKWLLDYRAASPQEQAIFKRLIPFYQFYRRALPVVVESMFTRPGVNSAFARLSRDPHEPEFSYMLEDGQVITLQDNGETLQVLANVDMPQTAVAKFMDALQFWNPDVAKKGWREIALLGHPAFHALLDAGTNFEVYRGKIDSKKRYNALGQALEKLGYEEGTLFVKEEGYNGEMNYEFDKSLLTSLIDAVGLGRSFDLVDRSVDGLKDLNDGEFQGVLRWFSGLRLEEWTGDDVRTQKAYTLKRALEEGMVERGMMDERSRRVLMTPDVMIKEAAEKRRRRQLLGRD